MGRGSGDWCVLETPYVDIEDLTINDAHTFIVNFFQE